MAGQDALLDPLVHLYMLHRGVLLTPFHNMALMSPVTTKEQVSRHTEVLEKTIQQLISGDNFIMRNPPWVRDELILALDLYFRINPSNINSSNSEIVKLSQLLNQLPIHTKSPDVEAFRNENSVYMKLSNFLALDEKYTGKGLINGSKLDEEIWREFGSNKELLTQTAKSIRTNYKFIKSSAIESIEPDEEFLEGRVLTRLHVKKERNARAAKIKKEIALAKTGRLVCEVCSFDFVECYGELGKNFAECHHKKPISELRAEVSTRLDDLAIVCANCHRMLHKSKPMLSLDSLRHIVMENRK